MKGTMRLWAMLAIPLLVLLGAGCMGDFSSNPTSNVTPDEQELDLNSEYGGYDTSDESPAFGDPELLKTEEDGVDAMDAFACSSAVMNIASRAGTDVYALRLTWGMLEGDSTVSELTDWSGTIKLDRGVIIVDRIILFEPGDYILRRVCRDSVGVVSFTGPHYDGLLITVLNPEADSTGAPEENVLTIDLGPFHETFTMDQLEEIQEVYDVDVTGNQFSIVGRYLTELPCKNGFIHGKWARNEADGGVFRGRWTTRRGLGRGYLNGHWGVNEEGDRVLFGKYIGLDGSFEGLIRGTWGQGELTGTGWFRGVWKNEEETVEGVLNGVWVDPFPYNGNIHVQGRPDHGFFNGRWIEACESDVVDEEYEEF
ncbi:MAG: hypothetical protein JW958_07475 [Candidatus Eisenbacteria bacterium]|nr:hypothetical protein [Candidatus Eisenbacteria bacterium]